MQNKIICFDLDNILCKTKNNEYAKSLPIKKNIQIVNNLFNKGYYIKIFTARYMGRNKDNVIKAKRQGYKFTQSQLKRWKIKYHKLIFGKPSFDLYIDDKSIFYDKSWANIIKQKIYEKNKSFFKSV